MDATILATVRKQLATPWRKHPALEYVALHGRGVARDGTTLVGTGPLGIGVPYFETTFYDDQVVNDMLVTGFQVLGGAARVTTEFDGVTRDYVIDGSMWLDKPILLEHGTKIRAAVIRNTRGKSLRFTVRGYAVSHGMVKSMLAELYAS